MTTIRAALFAAALAGCFSLSNGAQALDANDYMGRVGLVGADFCPRGTLAADGRTLQIADYSALFSLLTTTYGGDGKTTFKLPDLRGKEPVGGTIYCIVTNGVFPTRN